MSKTGDKNRRSQRRKGFFSEAAQAVKEGFQSKDKAKAAADERRAERAADDATTKEAVSETAQERYDGYRIMIENDSTMSETEKAETLAMFRRLWGIPEPEPEAEPKSEPEGDSEPKDESEPAADEPKDPPKSEPEKPKDEAETKAKSEGEAQTKGGDSAAAKAAPKQEPKVEPKTEPKAQPKTEPAKAQPATDGAIWKIGDGLKIGSVFYVHDYEHGGEYPVTDRWAAKMADPEYTPVRAWFKNGKYIRDLNLAELRHYFGA